MKTLHTTRNCKYRRFLHTQLKHGKISGRFYKFICRNYPYRLPYSVKNAVSYVLQGKCNEDKAIKAMKTDGSEIKRQKELMKSNIECRRIINIGKKDSLYEANR